MSSRGPCASCGAPLQGSYCHACGERDPQERDLTIRAFLRERVQAFGDLRGKGYRSIGLLIGRPGELTREYMAGRRVPYLHPLQLFLLANVLFFISLSFTGIQGLTSPLRSQLYEQSYSGLAREMLRERFLEQDSVAFQRFEARFDLASEVQAKSLIIVLVPMFALLLVLTRFWKREPGVQHLVFSTHYIAIVMLAFMLIGLVARIVSMAPPPWPQRLLSDAVFSTLLVALSGSYLFGAFRRGYGDTAGPALARAGVLALATIVLIVTYRLLLFFTVLYTV